ncbi:MAG: hypothetical protein AAF741_03145 [Bacteroidota bacterium]
MKQFLIALFLGMCSLSLCAQTMMQFIEDAELQHERENYYGAYDSYRIAFEFDEERLDLKYEAAENSRLYTAYGTAMRDYQYVQQRAAASEFPELQFRLGQVNQNIANYEEAIAHYEQYLADSPSGANRAEAQKNLEDSRWALDRMMNKDSFPATNLPRDINTVYSDFGFHRTDDSTFFSSNRVEFEEDKLDPNRFTSRIFRTPEASSTNISRVITDVIPAGKHAAHTAFNAAGDRVYYTICEYIGDTESVRCDLHFSSVSAEGRWGPPTKMEINVEGADNTQPHVALDPATGQEMLYFASDRPGTMGGLDLYKASLNADGTAGDVVNISALNTPMNDATPFMDSDGCKLYFSTEGRNTLGGYDIYSSLAANSEFGEPVHLNSPVNGSFRDRYYSIHRPDGKAYFSSNRQPESMEWPGEENACCEDIYSVPFDESIQVDAYTFRKLDNTELDRATVQLFLLEDDERELVQTVTQTTGNDFVLTLFVEPGYRYEIVGTRPAFGPATEILDLSDACTLPRDRKVRKDLFLPQELIVNVFDEKTRLPLNGARVRLADSEASLASPIADDTKEDTNRFDYLVRLDNPYYILADRSGYTSKDTTIIIPEAEVDDQGRYEVDIYLPKPDPVELIPVNLYFDNDYPHPRTRKRTADVEYVSTNVDYYAKKTEFIEDQITPGMSEEEAFQTRGQLDDFFENDVLGGRLKLIELAEALLESLELGVTYSMKVQGEASKRGNPAYNQILSERRVDCVMNFFKEWNNGALKDYIDEGDLVFDPSYVGDTQADPNDRSVTGLRASRSRRVTITELKATN